MIADISPKTLFLIGSRAGAECAADVEIARSAKQFSNIEIRL
jgi:hypothetical protein